MLGRRWSQTPNLLASVFDSEVAAGLVGVGRVSKKPGERLGRTHDGLVWRTGGVKQPRWWGVGCDFEG